MIQVERATILAHLRTSNFNLTESAKSLGVSRSTLYRKVKSMIDEFPQRRQARLLTTRSENEIDGHLDAGDDS